MNRQRGRSSLGERPFSRFPTNSPFQIEELGKLISYFRKLSNSINHNHTSIPLKREECLELIGKLSLLYSSESSQNKTQEIKHGMAREDILDILSALCMHNSPDVAKQACACLLFFAKEVSGENVDKIIEGKRVSDLARKRQEKVKTALRELILYYNKHPLVIQQLLHSNCFSKEELLELYPSVSKEYVREEIKKVLQQTHHLDPQFLLRNLKHNDATHNEIQTMEAVVRLKTKLNALASNLTTYFSPIYY